MISHILLQWATLILTIKPVFRKTRECASNTVWAKSCPFFSSWLCVTSARAGVALSDTQHTDHPAVHEGQPIRIQLAERERSWISWFQTGGGAETNKNDWIMLQNLNTEMGMSIRGPPSLSAAHDRIAMSLQPFTSTIKGKDWHLSLKQETTKLNAEWCAPVWCFF